MKKLAYSTRSLVATLLVCLLAMTSFPATADIQQVGERQFVVGVPTDQFVYMAAPDKAGKQQASNWCWAATIQMVLNYHGVRVSQQELVARLFGQLVDRPASGPDIIKSLQGTMPNAAGSQSQVFADPYQISEASIVRDLEYRWPLIVGLKGSQTEATGHAYVLTAAHFALDYQNQPRIISVVLRDPWPGRPSRTEMSFQDFMSRAQFATRVYVEHPPELKRKIQQDALKNQRNNRQQPGQQYPQQQYPQQQYPQQQYPQQQYPQQQYPQQQYPQQQYPQQQYPQQQYPQQQYPQQQYPQQQYPQQQYPQYPQQQW